MNDQSRRRFLGFATAGALRVDAAETSGFDPRGRIHIPIGIPNTVDTVKTFVEAEGNFSPGVGSYGVYYWIADEDGKLFAPTQQGVTVRRGLESGGLLIPWTEWQAGDVRVTTRVCHMEQKLHVVASHAQVENTSQSTRKVSLYVVLRPLGAAGFDVKDMRVDRENSALLVDGHPAIVAVRRATQMGVLETDTLAEHLTSGRPLSGTHVSSPTGDCSGGLRFDFTLARGARETVGIVCPVLAGRNAARHHWVDRRQNAMVDAAELNPASGGIPQPDPGIAYYRSLNTEKLFAEAKALWTGLLGGVDIRMPDIRWGESMRAILGHALMCLNEGAPDVAVVNYNVFNRDGIYIANMMQKAGLACYSEQVIDYFIAHPFNGRAYPEADNPGQILWAMHQHWLLTRDRTWLRRTYPAARQIAAMIRYYRTAPGPHWVAMDSLEFGDKLSPSRRRELEPGKCDGFHPEYTEAFDIAGLLGAANLAEVAGESVEAAGWRSLSEKLFAAYDAGFGDRLPNQYGSYSVLWPCRLYPLDSGRGYEQFCSVGAQQPKSWRYFPLATAHQGLLAGNRDAAHGTLHIHLAHEQMQGWYAFDEGGGSGSGAWYRTRTKWTHSKTEPGQNRAVAMPHGWAVAEFWLLMRDSIVFEQDRRLVLLAGVPPGWFRDPQGMHVTGLATYFGPLNLDYMPEPGGATLKLGRNATPPGGFLLRLPPELRATVTSAGKRLEVHPNGDCPLPAQVTSIKLHFA